MYDLFLNQIPIFDELPKYYMQYLAKAWITKPGVAGSIPGFSLKTTFGEPLGVAVTKPTQILNQPGGTGLYPGKPQKSFF